MSNTGLRGVKQKLMGSISAKITTSVLVLLVIGFFVYSKIVNYSISEVDSKRDAIQNKSHKVQGELMETIKTNSNDILTLQKENLELKSKIDINDTEAEVDMLESVVGAKLNAMARSAYLMIESAMLAGNAPLVQGQLENLLDLEDILSVTLWRGQDGHVGEAAFSDNFTIKTVNTNLDDDSFELRPKGKTVFIGENSRGKMIKMSIDTKSNQTMDNEFEGRKVTYLYIPLINKEECQICHGEDHAVRGVLEMAILREGVLEKQEALQKELLKLEKNKQMQFERQMKLQNEGMDKIKKQAENLKIEGRSDKNEIASIESKSARNRLLISIIFVVVLLASLTSLLNKLIIKPLSNAIKRISEIENEGDLTKRLTTTSQDEFSELAKWFNALVEKLEMIIGDISGNARSLAISSRELFNVSGTMAKEANTMSSLTNNVADNSEKMSSNMTAVANAAKNAEDNVNTVSTSANQMSENMIHITSTTEEVTANANTVATSIEEMSSTVSEISENTLKAASISEEASQKAVDAQTLMQNLGNSAKSVGKVIGVINDIADRTNLLALNATIEAASAGEAGKGFAVVANEVKELAKQTADATEEIVKQIEDMQGNTNSAVKAITDITETINEINSINSTIASAVEEQNATTNEVSKTTALTVQSLEDVKLSVGEAAKGAEEIAKSSHALSSKVSEISSNVANASEGAHKVSSNIQTVSISAESNSESAQKVSQSAGDMSSLSEKFQQVVNQFIISEKAKKQVSSPGIQASHMPLMVWSDRFSVNIKEIDDQHKKLIDFVNQLDSAMKGGKGAQVLGDVLSGLIEYTGFHFKNEENMMTEHNYPDYAEHKGEHDKLVKEAVAIQKGLQSGKAVVSVDVMEFLKDWLINHIIGTDKKYSPFFNKKGIY